MKTYLKSTLKRISFIIAFELVKFIWIALFCEFASTPPSELAFLAIAFAILAIEAPIYFWVLGDEEKKWKNLAIVPALVTVIYLIEWVIIDFASKHVEGETYEAFAGVVNLWGFGILWYASIFAMVGFYLTITLIDIAVTAIVKYKNRKIKIQ